MFIEVWSAADSNRNACELGRITPEGGHWLLSVTEGSFSGYPGVYLDRKQLSDLVDVLLNELKETAC